MKFFRWGAAGSEKPGVLDEQGKLRDLSALVKDISPSVIASGQLNGLSSRDVHQCNEVGDDVRIGACISRVPNFYCIGLNYHKPDAEEKMLGSNKIVIASKASTAISGPNDDIVLPANSQKTDWEVELGIVIGKPAWKVSEEEALDYVFGFCIVNDVCERDYMFEQGGQWVKGKSVPGYGPVGPWLVTKDEVGDPQDLALWLKRNGKTVQESNTSEMISGVALLVSHMSHYMKLIPGDLIATGTPPGIGMHQKPPAFLQEGDVLELGISLLGEQKICVRREGV